MYFPEIYFPDKREPGRGGVRKTAYRGRADRKEAVSISAGTVPPGLYVTVGTGFRQRDEIVEIRVGAEDFHHTGEIVEIVCVM